MTMMLGARSLRDRRVSRLGRAFDGKRLGERRDGELTNSLAEGDQLVARKLAMDDWLAQSLLAVAAQLIGFVLFYLLQHLWRDRSGV